MVKKFRKSDVFGDAVAATNLKSARIAAGYRSAASAALAHGWSENTLRGHESGTRSIHNDDAKKYAAAFKTDVKLFISPDAESRSNHDRRLADLESVKEVAASKETDKKLAVANRLRFARILRGFDTLSAACKYHGLSRPTAGAHENGFNSLSERMAEAYSVAYGVNIGWLLNGKLPSGMGNNIDKRIGGLRWLKKYGDLAYECRSLVSTSISVDQEHVRIQFEKALTKPRASDSSGDRMFEFESDNHRGYGPLEDLPASEARGWTLPPGLMSKLIGSQPSEVVIVPIDRPQQGWRLGDRLFVDRAKRDVSTGGSFLFYDSDRGIRIEIYRPGQPWAGRPALQDLVGKIVATFTAQRDG